MTGTYDAWLVALSVIIAVAAAYTALDLAGRVAAAQGRARAAWLVGGAATMGTGIWSMHFVGMLAFSLPIRVAYDALTALISLLIAILTSGLALALVSRPILRRPGWLAGGVLMGVGIAAMHYTGMAVMRMDAMTAYRPALVIASLAIAIGASLAALWLACRVRGLGRVWQLGTASGAVAMGLAIAGMHYVGMAAAVFTPMHMPGADAGIQPSGLGAAAIGIATLIALGGALLTALVDRRRAQLAARAAERAASLARERAARLAAERAMAQLQAVLDVLPVGVLIADATGHITQVNGAAHALWGGAPLVHDVEQYRTYKGWWPETGAPLASADWALARALGQGSITTGEEVEIESFDGARKTILNHAAPVRDESGAITGGVAAAVDITARRRLERRTHEALDALLRMAEALIQLDDGDETAQERLHAVALRLATLTRSVLDCRRVTITALDRQTGAPRPLAAVGLSAEEEQGWRSGGPGSALREYLSAEEVEHLWHEDVLCLYGGEVPARALPYGARAVLLAQLRASRQVVGVLALDHGGVAHAYTQDEVALARAVGRLIALVLDRERLLHERAEATASALALAEANRRMDAFLALASHELKTPLTGIGGNIEMMMRRLGRLEAADNPLAAPLTTMLDRVHQNLWRINRLVDDLLDMSRIQADRLELRGAPCDLATIVAEVVRDHCELHPEREVRLDLAGEHDIVVMGDADRLAQVLQNYLTNALKYAPPDRPIDVGARVEGARARVWVRDRGPGLPPHARDRIWERFYRVAGIEHQTGSRMGLGLGLYISRTIVEQHHGQVGVESVPGGGATFWFTLPLLSRQASPPAPRA